MDALHFGNARWMAARKRRVAHGFRGMRTRVGTPKSIDVPTLTRCASDPKFAVTGRTDIIGSICCQSCGAHVANQVWSICFGDAEAKNV